MLGRIVPGRLPTTQANLDLINARIKKVQFDMSVLDRKIQAGTIDPRQAGYQRQQLIGEVGELKRVIANSRLSTPSYKVPSDIRNGKPAKKYISYDDSRAFMSDYTGPARVNKMPSDWQATELTELDVPNVPKQTGSGAKWPSHWPGMHSPMIMKAVMELGEYNRKQIIDPRNSNMKLNLNMIQIPYHMDIALGIKSRYTLFYEQLATDPRFTNTDRTLVNIIMGKINLQISEAEKKIEDNKRAYNQSKELAEASKGQQSAGDLYAAQDDTNSGDKSVDLIPGTGNGNEAEVGTGKGTILAEEQVSSPVKHSSGNGWTIFVVKVTNLNTGALIREEWYATHPAKYGQAPQGSNGEYQYVTSLSKVSAAIDKRIANYDAAFKKQGKYIYYDASLHGTLIYSVKPTGYNLVQVYEKKRNNSTKYNYNFFYHDKLFVTMNNQSKKTSTQVKGIINDYNQYLFNNQTNQYAENGHPLVFYASGGKGGYESLGGYHKTARMGRRNGSLMGFGAMQSHDRRRNMSPQQRVLSRTQRQSYLAAERELSMAKARAGAKVDITKELKEAPVTRPWSMQVTLPVNAIEQLHMQLDSALSSIGLAQSMFTQQAHNYIAQMVNSLDSSMQPSDRTEFVVEKIMSEMVNRSALLKDNVRVDVRQNGWPPVNITPAETTSVDGLGSAFLKTKAAMGRLLG
jgi:hypothetical protein